MAHWWNGTDKAKLMDMEKNMSSATLSTRNTKQPGWYGTWAYKAFSSGQSMLDKFSFKYFNFPVRIVKKGDQHLKLQRLFNTPPKKKR